VKYIKATGKREKNPKEIKKTYQSMVQIHPGSAELDNSRSPGLRATQASLQAHSASMSNIDDEDDELDKQGGQQKNLPKLLDSAGRSGIKIAGATAATQSKDDRTKKQTFNETDHGADIHFDEEDSGELRRVSDNGEFEFDGSDKDDADRRHGENAPFM